MIPRACSGYAKIVNDVSVQNSYLLHFGGVCLGMLLQKPLQLLEAWDARVEGHNSREPDGVLPAPDDGAHLLLSDGARKSGGSQ